MFDVEVYLHYTLSLFIIHAGVTLKIEERLLVCDIITAQRV